MQFNERPPMETLLSATNEDGRTEELPQVRLTCPAEDGFLSFPIDVCLFSDVLTSPDSSSVPSSPCFSTTSSSSFTPSFSSCSSVTDSSITDPPAGCILPDLLSPGCPYIDGGRTSIDNTCSQGPLSNDCASAGGGKFFRNKVRAQWKALNQLRSSFDVSASAQSERNAENGATSKSEITRALSLRKSRLQIPFRRSAASLVLPKIPHQSTPHTVTKQEGDDMAERAAAGESTNEFQRSWKEGTKRPFEKKSKRHRRPSSQWGTFLNVFADVLRFRKTKSREWFQLGGHKGTFREGLRNCSLLKAQNENERQQYISMQCDVMSAYIPRFYGVVRDDDGKEFIELEDLLYSFKNPSVMDVKVGVRTYLESDVTDGEKGPVLREDLYQKMISIDENEPTDEEHQQKAISKPRYMIWRENLSSTTSLGFRIEAIKKANDDAMKDFQRSKTREDVMRHLSYFVNRSVSVTERFLKRLKEIKKCLMESLYFSTHEVIGSSLLFVYDKQNAGIWLIDFAKTVPLPDGVRTTHLVPWTAGSHEDGYLLGLNNLIDTLHDLRTELATTKQAEH